MANETTEGAPAPAPPPAATAPEATATAPKSEAAAPKPEIPPTGESPKPEAGKAEAPKEVPSKTEPPKAEVKVDIVSKADQLKIPEKISDAEAEYLKGKLDSIAKSAIEAKMPLAEAQKVFESKLQDFREVAAFGDARIKAAEDAWTKEIQADPKLGGGNMNRTSQLTERGLIAIFGKEIYEKDLKNFFLAKRPDIVRKIVEFADNVGDAKLPPLGDKPAPPPKPPLTLGQKVYGENYDPMKVGNTTGAPR